MQTINERFKIIVDTWYQGNDSAFSQAMGKFASSFAKVINGTTNPRASTLYEVCRLIPELNPTWLLMGEGSMLRQALEQVPRSEREALNEVIKAKSEELKSKDELIAILKNYVEDLRAQKA